MDAMQLFTWLETELTVKIASSDQGSISRSTKIHLKMTCQIHHSELYCDIMLCLATKIGTQLKINLRSL